MAEEKLHSGLKKYTINTSFLFLERALRAIVMIVFWVFVIRYLGPDQFGIFSYALSIIAIFDDLCAFGIRDIAVREIVRNPQKENEILGSVFFIKLVIATFSVVIILVFITLSSLTPLIQLLIMILSIQFFFKPFETIDYFFQSQVLSQYLAFSRAFEMVISSTLYVSLVLFKKPLVYFAWVNVFEIVALSLGLIFFYYCLKKKSIFSWRGSFSMGKDLMRDSWPLMFSSVAGTIYFRIDQIMIKEFLNTAEVGIYSVAVRMCEAFYFIPIVVTNSVLPAIFRAKSVSQDSYFKRNKALISFLLTIALMISLGVTLFSRPLVELFFGADFIASAKVLQVQIWAIVFIFIGVAANKCLIGENLQKYSMITKIMGAVLNIVLNLFLIPLYGIKGAAVATLITLSLPGFFGYALFRKTRPVFFLQIKAFNLYDFWKNNINLFFEMRRGVVKNK